MVRIIGLSEPSVTTSAFTDGLRKVQDKSQYSDDVGPIKPMLNHTWLQRYPDKGYIKPRTCNESFAIIGYMRVRYLYNSMIPHQQIIISYSK